MRKYIRLRIKELIIADFHLDIRIQIREIQEIMAFMEHALEEVKEQITQDMSAYDKVKTVYTYLIDHAEYEASGMTRILQAFSGKRKLCVPDMRGRYSIFWNSLEFRVFM
mgnify:CR=1 FL=1